MVAVRREPQPTSVSTATTVATCTRTLTTNDMASIIATGRWRDSGVESGCVRLTLHEMKRYPKGVCCGCGYAEEIV